MEPDTGFYSFFIVNVLIGKAFHEARGRVTIIQSIAFALCGGFTLVEEMFSGIHPRHIFGV